MKKIIPLLLITAVLFTNCDSKKSLVRAEAKKERLVKLDESLNEKKWKAIFEIAAPLDNRSINLSRTRRPAGSANRIPLTGSEYIEIEGDSIYMALSYYGTFKIGTNYAPAFAREFRLKSKLLAYERYFDQEKNYHALRMKVKYRQEELTLLMKLYSNDKTVLIVNSNHRTSISYHGTFQKLNS